MGVNQVKFGNATVMDISDSTVAPETLLSGVTAYNKAGNKITGEVVVEHVEVEPVLETGTKSATITVGEESADIYCENTKAEVKNMKATQSATITNGIAQFECIDKNFVKSLKLTMEPIQDLHGYDHPWAGGAGKNKLDLANASLTKPSWYGGGWNNASLNSDYGITIQRTYAQSGAGGFTVDNLAGGKTYTISFEVPDISLLYRIGIYYSTNGTDTTTLANSESTRSGTGVKYYTFDLPSEAKYVCFRPTLNTGTPPYDIYKIQIEEGSTATTFEPYSNICPIRGRTKASVTRTGKNVFNLEKYLTDNNITYTKDGEWFIFSIYSALYANKFTLPELGYYSGQLIIDSARTVATNVNLRTYKNGSAVTQGQTFTNQQIDQVGFNYSTTGQVCCKVQAEYGANNTPYEPYTAESYTKEFGQTVYGGYYNFIDGIGESEREFIEYDGSSDENWELASTSGKPIARIIKPSTIKALNILANPFNIVTNTTNLEWGKWYIGGTNIVFYWEGTLEEWRTYIASNPIQICWKPENNSTTISTNAEKITTLPGVNVISATEPISECNYRVLEENLSDTIYSNETLVGEDSDVYTFRTAPDISDANYVEEKIVGGSVVWNQLVQNGNFADTSQWGVARGTFTVANNICTFKINNMSSNADARRIIQTFSTQANRVYLAHATFKAPYSFTPKWLFMGGNYENKEFYPAVTANTWTECYTVIKTTESATQSGISFNITSTSQFVVNDEIQIQNIYFTDLTAMFGSAVADYVYNLENTTAGTGVAFLKKYGFFTQDYYDYDVGSLQSVNFNRWFKTGKNLLNLHTMQTGGAPNIVDGDDIYYKIGNVGTTIHSYDYKSQLPGNRTYTLQFDPPTDVWVYAVLRVMAKDGSGYTNAATIDGWDKKSTEYRKAFYGESHVEITATIPDCAFCEFGVGYMNAQTDPKDPSMYIKFSNIQVELGSEATRYEPYEGETFELDDALELRGLFKIQDNKLAVDGDIYESSGKITRKYAVVDLGTLTWVKQANSTKTYFRTANEVSDMKPNSSVIATQGLLCSPYLEETWTHAIDTAGYDTTICEGWLNKSYIAINDESKNDLTAEQFKTAMSGVILQYELAEPLLNGETGFDSPQVFIPNGNEYFVKTYASTPDRDFDIPAGHVGKYYGKSMFKEISLPTIPKSSGTYILMCNVLADGNKKLYWRADNN